MQSRKCWTKFRLDTNWSNGLLLILLLILLFFCLRLCLFLRLPLYLYYVNIGNLARHQARNRAPASEEGVHFEMVSISKAETKISLAEHDLNLPPYELRRYVGPRYFLLKVNMTV